MAFIEQQRIEQKRVKHNLEPVYDENSRLIILGSFPSVKSREQHFYYAHPQNRFWKVISAIYDEPVPDNVQQKIELLKRRNIALWDVIASCEITGSADSSIKNATPNDICAIIRKTKITRIFTNGKTADSLYKKYIFEKTGITAKCLPSTSPANAAFSQLRLAECWSIIKKEAAQ